MSLAQVTRRGFPVVVVLMLIADALLADGRGVWLIAGAAAGVELIWHVPQLSPELERSEHLIRTLAPLVLPLLVVGAVGTVEQPKWVQLLAATVVIVAGWRFVVLPDDERIDASLAIEPVALRQVLTVGAKIAGLAAFLGVPLWFLVASDSTLRGSGDFAGSFLLVAVAAWVLIALPSRLAAYATSWLRLVVSVFLLVTVLALAIFVGYLPGDPSPATIVPPLIAIGLALAAFIAAILVDGDGPVAQQALPEAMADTAAAIGLGAALVASVFITIAAIGGLVQTANPNGDDARPAFSHLPPVGFEDPGRAIGKHRDEAERYQPVLALTNHERWSPIRVEEYLPTVRLTGPGTDVSGPRLASLPRSCPDGRRAACYMLTIPDCHDGDLACAPDTVHEGTGLEQMGADYVRALELDKPLVLPRPYERRELATILQYWFFYRYDRWNQHVLQGELTQQHQGDWEAVSIGLDRSGDHPLFAAYSAHCGGTVEPWDRRRRRSRTPLAVENHLLVAVAEGSQANYPNATVGHAPDWIGCGGRPKGLMTLVSYASNIRDKTEYGRFWYPKTLIAVNRDTPPMSFVGRWGEEDRMDVKLAETRSFKLPGAPASPPLQGSWTDPMETIFCGDYKGATPCTGAVRGAVSSAP